LYHLPNKWKIASPTLPAGNYYIRFTKPADGAVINMTYLVSLPGYSVTNPTNTDLDAEALDWSTTYSGDVFYHNGGALSIDAISHVISGTPVQSYFTLKVFNKDTGALAWSIPVDNQFNGATFNSPAITGVSRSALYREVQKRGIKLTP